MGLMTIVVLFGGVSHASVAWFNAKQACFLEQSLTYRDVPFFYLLS